MREGIFCDAPSVTEGLGALICAGVGGSGTCGLVAGMLDLMCIKFPVRSTLYLPLLMLSIESP